MDSLHPALWCALGIFVGFFLFAMYDLVASSRRIEMLDKVERDFASGMGDLFAFLGKRISGLGAEVDAIKEKVGRDPDH